MGFFDDKQVLAISTKGHHTLVTVMANGGSTELYAFGVNNYGQLGLQNLADGTTAAVNTPHAETSPQLLTFFNGKTVQLTQAGEYHSLVVAGLQPKQDCCACCLVVVSAWDGIG